MKRERERPALTDVATEAEIIRVAAKLASAKGRKVGRPRLPRCPVCFGIVRPKVQHECKGENK